MTLESKTSCVVAAAVCYWPRPYDGRIDAGRARRAGADVVGRLVNAIDSERYARDYAAASTDPRRAELAAAAVASERAALQDVIGLLEEDLV